MVPFSIIFVGEFCVTIYSGVRTIVIKDLESNVNVIFDGYTI